MTSVDDYRNVVVHDGVTIEFDSDLETIDVVHLTDAAIAELEAKVEQWVWVAHMVWVYLDDHPFDARSYPSRLAAKWRPGLSFYDGCFYDLVSTPEETP